VRQALVLISTQNESHRSLAELLDQPSLDPDEVMLVYEQFYLLDTLTYHSDHILLLLHRHYLEEFK